MLMNYCIAKLLPYCSFLAKKRGMPHSLGQTSKYGNVNFHCVILEDKMKIDNKRRIRICDDTIY